MKKNRVLEKLRSGEIVSVTNVGAVPLPWVVEALAVLGHDPFHPLLDARLKGIYARSLHVAHHPKPVAGLDELGEERLPLLQRDPLAVGRDVRPIYP